MTQTYKSELLKMTPLGLRSVIRDTRDAIRNVLLTPEKNYQRYLKYKSKSDKPHGYPTVTSSNAVLRNRQEWESALSQVKSLGLPPSNNLPKNWDSLIALDCILRKTNSEAEILDAGAEVYSVILPWLYLYGYRNLQGINPVFKKPLRRGPINYEYGDITQTRFANNTFDAVTCLSVIEHGVDLHSYFQEVSRILKPDGILITSTDYYDRPIDTRNLIAYGVPIHIFSKDEIMLAINTAREYGLEMKDMINLDCQETPVRWEEFDLNYTFVVFTLQKIGSTSL
ncbi:MAG: hypothetical protein NVSMB33_14870 [Ktedonobacteraceae bacterium]